MQADEEGDLPHELEYCPQVPGTMRKAMSGKFDLFLGAVLLDAGQKNDTTDEDDEDQEEEEEETESDEEVEEEDSGVAQDCEYNDWQKWTECSETCGGGSRKRTRSVKTEAKNGGKACQAEEKKQTEDCNEEDCPVDCVISDWQDWGHCAPDCKGKRKRSRMIIQAASHGGEACGETKEEESCDGVCTDCEYEDWSAWVACPVTCGGGNQNRSRDVAVPPTNGGKACVGNKTEMRPCGAVACPVDCALNDWSNWTACEPYCAGNMSRHRTVKTLPMNGGAVCGVLNETQPCTNFCMDCSWSDWTAWTNCTVPCGGGAMNRSRDQTFAAKAGAGGVLLQLAGTQIFGFELKMWKKCDSSHQASDALPLAEAQEKCKVTADCLGLSDTGCDGKQVVLCTSGFVLETDVSACAYNKKEIGGGKPCEGDGLEMKNCNTDPCPVDCVYSDWAEWSVCEPYCSGNTTRSRSIVAEAAHGGVACVKEELREQKACANFCMDCQVSDWTEWETCSVSCGGGDTNRTRTETYINRPNLTASLLEVEAASTAFGYEKRLGVRCSTESLGPQQKEFLPARAERKCSLDSTCYALYDKDCNGGLRVCKTDFELEPEEGSCVYVKKEIGEGRPCDGNIFEAMKCNRQKCPIDCQYKDWSDWGSCNPLCEGTRERSRKVKKYAAFGGQPCDNKTQSEECTNICVDCEWSDWTAWTNCSVSCGGGMQERGRGVAVEVEGFGKNCTGDAEEKRQCNMQDCPVDCETSDWSGWSSCEPFCQGMQNQTRTITLQAANGGLPCGPLFHTRACNNTCLDCQWSNWTEWGQCSTSCGGGVQSRSRYVARPKVGEAEDCTGPLNETQACNEQSCPIDCVLADWSKWSDCDPYCIGTQSRNRSVVTEPEFGGVTCGNISETQRCTNFCMDCQLSDWTTWASCSKTCAGGSQYRLRDEVYVQRMPSSFIQLQAKAGSRSSTGAWGYQKKMGVRCDPKHQRSADGVGTPQEAEALCSADPTCGGLYDHGCDNWVTLCNTNFTLESEEGSCSYLKKEIGRGEPCQGNISETMTCNEQMCPVDCVMTDWTDWSACDPFCNGTQKRERNITTHAAFGGIPCGPTLEDQRCSNFCVDCAWTDWTAWPPCTVSCGGGSAQRSRSIATPKQGGGQECTGSDQETKTCSEQECPVDCELSTWTAWTGCEPYCEGSQTRQRNVTRKASFGGKSCNSLAASEPDFTGGVTKQIRQCSNLCRDCGWLDWTPFSTCTATCGNGTKSRSRDQLFVLRTNRSGPISTDVEMDRVFGYELQMNVRCDAASRREGTMVFAAAKERCDADPTCGGVYDEGCDGTVVLCNIGFSLHEEAGSCSRSKLEMGGGSACDEVDKLQVEQCNTKVCPRDCQYGDWSAWTVCEPWCNGTQARNRAIILEEEEGGKPCFATAESRECSNYCVNCRWADWSTWSDCSASCGGGSQMRSRAVAVPKDGRGEECVGNGTETQICADLNCPVDCQLSDWTAWSSCQPHCLGEQNRSRKILSQPRFGGALCGDLAEQRKCANLCMDCVLSGWEEWGDCSASCGGGRRQRLRTETYVSRNQSSAGLSLLEVDMQALGYEKKMGVKCDEAHQRELGVAGQPPLTAQASCSGDASCGALYDKGCTNFWSICDAGFVLEAEEGSCSYIKKEIGEGEACEGNIAQKEDCNIENCPLDCEYTEWTEWSTCEPFCSGLTNRTRNITREPQNGGLPCSLKAQVNNCTNVCVDCEWGTWSEWSNCTASCNGGTHTRQREVAVPVDGGGKTCSGNRTEVGVCADKIACPVDCELTDWDGWTPCTPYCSGTQQRSRSIVTQPFAGGAACGVTAEEVSCNNTCIDCQVSSWTDWSECSKTCSGGTQHRSRGILKQAEGEGMPCPEELQQAKEDMCAPLDCPVDCLWGDWLPWNGCSVTCGEGTQDRTRVEVVSAQYGGVACEGSSQEWRACDVEICPVDRHVSLHGICTAHSNQEHLLARAVSIGLQLSVAC
ncbi:SSPO [Symbiodinium natans]|uniref:SSPO protein n=1 Tax=Symbiodinium natans TaxID=878477 RepID=A0A812LSS6_9DINO|nr:SSPO [Symbiodinium natans]